MCYFKIHIFILKVSCDLWKVELSFSTGDSKVKHQMSGCSCNKMIALKCKSPAEQGRRSFGRNRTRGQFETSIQNGLSFQSKNPLSGSSPLQPDNTNPCYRPVAIPEADRQVDWHHLLPIYYYENHLESPCFTAKSLPATRLHGQEVL